MHRDTELAKLKEQSFDLLIVGGGATGTGCALEAASRGIKVALIEKNDFASSTSSRSTKLIHGGVRYLEQAVLKFDRSQFKLVRDALKERAILLKNAPHVVHPLPLLTPIYSWSAIPYYLAGLKIYDRLSGRYKINKSKWLDQEETLKRFPQLEKKKLKGSVLYYDGQFDDSRFNVLLARTAHDYSAVVCNYIEAVELLKTDGKISGARVRNTLGGEFFEIEAKAVINATGPFVDRLRKLDNTTAVSMVNASSGAHIVLDKKFCAKDYGLLIPKTDDGRVLFFLPWHGHSLVGTTDNPAAIVENPKSTEEDIQYLIDQVRKYFSHAIEKKDVLSSWCGLRPLISNPGSFDTAKLSRDHEIQVSQSGLVTIAGGKWTTYRKMSEDTIDHTITSAKLKAPFKSQTPFIKIKGAEKYSADFSKNLQKKFNLPEDIAEHLAHAYGDQSEDVLKMGTSIEKISDKFPYIKSEIIYGIRKEQGVRLTDVLARRLRMAFLDEAETLRGAPEVAAIMAQELGWDEAKIDAELKDLESYL